MVGSEEEQALAADMGDRAVVVPLSDPDAATDVIVALDGRAPIDAVVAVDDQGVLVAAFAGERLGFPHNPPDAVAATRDKASMRAALGAAEVPQPRYAVADDPDTFIPDREWFKHAKIVMPKPKEAVTLRLDPDVLTYFRKAGRGYQTRINAVLKAFVESRARRAG